MSSADEQPGESRSVHNVNKGGVGGDLVQAETVNIYPRPEVATFVAASLPQRPSIWVNREDVFADLDAWTRPADREAAKSVMLTGPGGVGKSALIVEAGYRVGEHFPDGKLYVDLDKHRRDGGTALSDVLSGFLLECGLKRDDIPESFYSKVAKYRAVVQSKRMLVVVDNVEHESEVDALSPTSPTCTMIAACTRMDDFVVRGEFLRVEPLGQDAAHALLRRLLGEQRIAGERDATAELVQLCGGYPEVLWLAATPLLKNEFLTVARRVEMLQADMEVVGETLGNAVAGRAFGALSSQARRLCRRLAWHPGPDFSTAAVESVCSGETGATYALLEELLDTHLLQQLDADRYRIRHLVGVYAQRQPYDDDEAAGPGAWRQWDDWYLPWLQAADHAVMGARTRSVQPSPPPHASFDSAASATNWLVQERQVLLALQRAAAAAGDPWTVLAYGEPMWALYMNVPFPIEFLDSSTLNLEAALEVGDAVVTSRMRSRLARALTDQGEYAAAAEQLGLALQDAPPEKHPAVAATAFEIRGRLFSRQELHAAAIEEYGKAIEGFIQVGNLRGAALSMHFTGQSLLALGELSAAISQLRAALEHLSESTHARTVGKVHTDLGQALHRSRDLSGAEEALRTAVRLLAERAPRYEATARHVLADVLLALGDEDGARNQLRRVRGLYEPVAHPDLAAVEAQLDELDGEVTD